MTTSANIIFLSTRAPYPPSTGHFQRTYNILTRLSEHADVHLFAFYDRGLKQEDRRQVRAALEKHCRSVYLESLPADDSLPAKILLGARGLLSTKPIVALKYYRPGMQEAIKRCLETTDIQIVHLDLLPLIEYAGLFGDLPAVLTNHNVESVRLATYTKNQKNPVKRLFYRMQNSRLKRYEAEAVRASSIMITVSEDDSRYLAGWNPNCRFEVIPNGTDTSRYQTSDSAKNTSELPPVVLWVGSAVDPYNRQAIDFFCDEILPPLLSRNSDVVFRFVGKMPEELRQRLVAHFGRNFDYCGFVPDVREYYEQARLVCIPLLSGSGTKLKVIEAMAMGRAVVTTPIGAEGLPVADGVHLSIRSEPQEIVNEVIDLLTDDNRRRELETSGRSLVASQFDWDRIVERQWRIYEDMIGERQR